MLENSAPSGSTRPPELHGAAPASPIEFVQALHTKTGLMEVQIVAATGDHINYWAKNIQPEISKEDQRPDRNWNWVALFDKKSLTNRIARLFGQVPQTFCIIACDLQGDEFPIGMLHLVERYQWIRDKTKHSSFIWYLSSAPKHMIEQRCDQEPRMMAAFIDAGLVVSMNAGHAGRLFLHADPVGGQKLKESYIRAGMEMATEDASISMARRVLGRRSQRKHGNAGDYFYVDEAHAGLILNLSDILRSYSAGGDNGQNP